MAIETIKVPDLGGADGVEVIEIAVAVGDSISAEDTLLVLESDKATMDVPSPVAGVVKKILVKLGDKLSKGNAIVEMESEQETASATTEVEKASAPEAAASEPAPVPTTAAAAPAPAASEERPVLLPDLGTSEAVDVIEIAAKEGDEVADGEGIMTLEGDKATMEVPAPFSGTIVKILIAQGDKVKSGQQVAIIKTAMQAPVSAPVPAAATPSPAASATAPAPKAVPVAEDKPAATPAASAVLAEPQAPAAEVYAGPMVRHFARELGVDLRRVPGTGAKGRIQKTDVEAYVKQALAAVANAPSAVTSGGAIPAIPDVDFARFGKVEEIPLSRIGKLTATNMSRTWLNVPAVTQFDDADITDLEQFRNSLKAEAEKRGVKVTPVAFLMLACAKVLADNPVINRSWHSSGEKLIQKHYIHIGMAVDTPKGLLVPVIRDVDKKGLFEIAADIATMAEKARTGKLSGDDMQGGSFSISSLGAIGGRGFTPIVNAPEAAILGVSKASIQPVWNGSEFLPRQMLPLSLSYDHRLVNGAAAGKFLTELVAVLGDLRRMLL